MAAVSAELRQQLQHALGSSYSLVRELGAGGMATVYLARDIKHSRQVAVKVFRPEMGALLGSKRFFREIELTANLQHPQILPLFDSGEAAGLFYFVTPYHEGESLRARLRREGQLAVDEAVDIARDVLGALDYAHRHGVIHRDIKPENILLGDGRALVADFGIALGERFVGGERISTGGLLIGTPGYMSPEQSTAERQIDARSDIWSVGCVLYEMLAGRRPHGGATSQAVLTSVLSEEPEPLAKGRAGVPSHISLAVHRALSKLPADRFDTAGSFERALTLPTGSISTTLQGRPSDGTPRRWRANPAVRSLVAAIIAALLATGGWLARSRFEPTPQSIRFYVADDPGRVVEGPLALSPDGSTLVFGARAGSGSMLFEQSFSDLDARAVPGTTGAPDLVFFSPDGRWIGFVMGRSIRKIKLDGSGSAIVVSMAEEIAGAAWASDENIVFATWPSGHLFRVNAGGGTPSLIPLDAPRGASPRLTLAAGILPGGNALLSAMERPGRAPVIVVISLATGEMRPVGEGYWPKYLAPGYLLFARSDGSILVQPFDARRMRVTGFAQRLVQGNLVDFGVGYFDVSRTGSLAYTTRESAMSELALFDLRGARQVLTEARHIWVPRFSPDGRRIAYGEFATEGEADVWLYDLRHRVRRGLTTGGAAGRDYNDPVWSQDGRELAISAYVDSAKHIYRIPSDGSSAPKAMVVRPGSQYPTDWALDDKSVVFTEYRDGFRSIWLSAPAAGGNALELVKGDFNASGGRVSLDGHWLAYESDETGGAEVYVQPFPGIGARRLISSGGGRSPAWGRSGTELFYLKGDSLMAVHFLSGSVLGDTRISLMLTVDVRAGRFAQYDVHPDGKRVAISMFAKRPRSQIAVITSVLAGAER